MHRFALPRPASELKDKLLALRYWAPQQTARTAKYHDEHILRMVSPRKYYNLSYALHLTNWRPAES